MYVASFLSWIHLGFPSIRFVPRIQGNWRRSVPFPGVSEPLLRVGRSCISSKDDLKVSYSCTSPLNKFHRLSISYFLLGEDPLSGRCAFIPAVGADQVSGISAPANPRDHFRSAFRTLHVRCLAILKYSPAISSKAASSSRLNRCLTKW